MAIHYTDQLKTQGKKVKLCSKHAIYTVFLFCLYYCLRPSYFCLCIPLKNGIVNDTIVSDYTEARLGKTLLVLFTGMQYVKLKNANTISSAAIALKLHFVLPSLSYILEISNTAEITV